MSGDEILASNIQIRNIFLLGVVRTGHVFNICISRWKEMQLWVG